MFKDITRDDVYRIETRQLWLRWPRLSDAAAIAHYLSDYRIADMTSRIPHPYPPAEADRYIFTTRDANADGKGLGLVITRLGAPTEIIGSVGLFLRDLPQSLEIGYWIGVPHWGKSYATEAVRAMIDTGFSLSRTDAIVATVKPENTASIRVLEHCGFVKSGETERFMPARGQTEPVVTFALTRDNWSATHHWSTIGTAA
jgi:RimJ/RimL family protein N-acetyltransferase